MRQDELDFIETLPATPVLDRRGPTMTGVTQAMDENDRGRVPGCCREEEGRLSNEGCHLVVCYWCCRKSGPRMFCSLGRNKVGGAVLHNSSLTLLAANIVSAFNQMARATPDKPFGCPLVRSNPRQHSRLAWRDSFSTHNVVSPGCRSKGNCCLRNFDGFLPKPLKARWESEVPNV